MGIPGGEPSDRVRPWPSPRCHGCRDLISDTATLRTLAFPDSQTGLEESFSFLFCGSCGTTFAIRRLDDT